CLSPSRQGSPVRWCSASAARSTRGSPAPNESATQRSRGCCRDRSPHRHRRGGRRMLIRGAGDSAAPPELQRRLVFAIGIIALALLALIARLWQLQIVRGEE